MIFFPITIFDSEALFSQSITLAGARQGPQTLRRWPHLGEIRCSACGETSIKFYKIRAIYNYPEIREDLYLCTECQRSNRLTTFLPLVGGFIVLLVWMLMST